MSNNNYSHSGGRSSSNNSINQVVEYLNKKVLASESEILMGCWGFKRSASGPSNKKYADLIRRGLKSGKIARVELDRPNYKAKFFYYNLSQK